MMPLNSNKKQLEISMPRGDLYPVYFSVVDLLDRSVNIEFDDIYFTLKDWYRNQEAIFQKRLSTGEIVDEGHGHFHFMILPEDTENLSFGIYTFDIELVKVGSIKDTTTGRLELTEESTWRSNE